MKAGQKVNGVITIKPTIVKGSQNHYHDANIDANSLAQIQAQKVKEDEMIKKQKIESFMNSTKMNASKLYKQKIQQNQQKVLSKKEKLDKQKQLKSKYTVVRKSEAQEKIKALPKEPMHVNWKQAEDAMKKVQIPVERLHYDSSGSQSGYDSEVDPEKNQTPVQVIQTNKKVREHMLAKLKR